MLPLSSYKTVHLWAIPVNQGLRLLPKRWLQTITSLRTSDESMLNFCMMDKLNSTMSMPFQYNSKPTKKIADRNKNSLFKIGSIIFCTRSRCVISKMKIDFLIKTFSIPVRQNKDLELHPCLLYSLFTIRIFCSLMFLEFSLLFIWLIKRKTHTVLCLVCWQILLFFINLQHCQNEEDTSNAT